MYPDKHTHVAVVCIFGNGERQLVFTTATHLGGLGEGGLGEVLHAFEVVVTITVVVDGHTKGGSGVGGLG